jgi:hypothetical protein
MRKVNVHAEFASFFAHCCLNVTLTSAQSLSSMNDATAAKPAVSGGEPGGVIITHCVSMT